MDNLFKSALGHNWLYFGLRWLMLVGFALATFLMQARTRMPEGVFSSASVQDILLVLGVGILATLILGVFSAVNALRPFIIYPKLIGDWLIAGLFVYLADGNTTLILGVTAILIVSGILRLGSTEGLFQAAGIIVAAAIGVLLSPNIGGDKVQGTEAFQNATVRDIILPGYIALTIFVGILIAVAAVWANYLNEENSRRRKSVRKEMEENRIRIRKMQDSSRMFSEMAAQLNATLNYDKILETALSIGRLSLVENLKQRAVAMALLVEDRGNLEVATSQGLNHNDMEKRFQGRVGIIARVMDEGEVEIMDDAEQDPELNTMVSFRQIKSVLGIPLRAGYNSYGVLVYGSSEPNAFSADNIEVLKALGVQATIALTNSVLYNTLKEEKERIINIDKNARSTLVRDLHDTVTQTISAIAMHLPLLPTIAQKQPEKLRDEVDDLRARALRAVEEMRNVMFTLRPQVLESQGLGAALNELKQRMEKSYRQNLSLDIDKNSEMLLSSEQQEMLFYLTEEASTNARKYAEASLIKIQLMHEGTDVVLRIEDDGKGFDMALVARRAAGTSYGMLNMKERAGLIGGIFELDTAPGKGTRIAVRIAVGIEAPTRNGKRETAERHSIRKERQGPLSPSR